mgnify:CR=1 FL=1
MRPHPHSEICCTLRFGFAPLPQPVSVPNPNDRVLQGERREVFDYLGNRALRELLPFLLNFITEGCQLDDELWWSDNSRVRGRLDRLDRYRPQVDNRTFHQDSAVVRQDFGVELTFEVCEDCRYGPREFSNDEQGKRVRRNVFCFRKEDCSLSRGCRRNARTVWHDQINANMIQCCGVWRGQGAELQLDCLRQLLRLFGGCRGRGRSSARE